jgi:hypothetical protein
MKVRTGRAVLCAGSLALALTAAAQPAQEPPSSPRTFDTPQQAADALIAAAAALDVAALEHIFTPEARALLAIGTDVKAEVEEFSARARERNRVTLDPTGNRAILSVGSDDWPLPVPIVRKGGRWSFDARAGRQELLHRRIGSNELDAIEVCRGFVEAQHEYALTKREGSSVNQYAQRIISTPGTQNGLAWQNPDGSWGGPVGESIARAIQQGDFTLGQPYNGYYFKVLTGQGPAAPLGEMDFLVKGLMIGGFALVASPAEYGVTGVQTFMVSHDGVVYEKDLGADTLNAFKTMERFNPDKTWNPVDQP